MFFELFDMNFEPLKIYGYNVLFTKERIDPAILPKGIRRYEIRKDQLEMEIGDKIHYKYYGTILSGKKITLKDGYKPLNPIEDIEYTEMEVMKLMDYLKMYPNLQNIVKKYS